MPYLVVGVLILIGLIVLIRAFINADPARLGRVLGWFVLSLGAAGGVALLVLLLISDRLIPALALVGAAAPLVMRGRTLWRRWQTIAGPTPGKTSMVETEFLRMRLDHDSGAMTGTVKRGPYAGRRLDELDEAALIDLWRQCRIAEEESARLIEAYLDRLEPRWRERADAASDAPSAAPSDAMTREEAYAILSLSPGATPEQIKDAHRRLMMKLHPDQGGSTYLAAKINRAKEILLGG